MVAGALGAIVGDTLVFWIARKSAAKMQGQLDKALENPKVRAGWDTLDRSPGLLIVAGRYVPGMRFAVNASMGLSDIPYRRFLVWSVLSGILWSVYTCASPTGWRHRSPAFRSRPRDLLGDHICRLGGGLLRRTARS